MIEKLSDGLDEETVEVFMVDIEENEELTEELKVRSVPTFYLFKGKELLNQCSGADVSKVHALLKEHL
jgi:thioredoxin 1